MNDQLETDIEVEVAKKTISSKKPKVRKINKKLVLESSIE